MGKLRIRRLGYALGAEVTGIDVSAPLDDATIDEIRRAWLENIVLVLPGQNIEAEQLMAFTSRFGELEDNRQSPKDRYPGIPEVLLVSNKKVSVNGQSAGGYRNGRKWHSDFSYTLRPSTGSFLVAKEIPDVGGNTLFGNMYAAYETLSPAMRAMIEPLRAIHDVTTTKDFDKKTPLEQETARTLNPLVVHPVVKVHDETGRKVLYMGERVRRFVGMTAEESRPLVEFLNRHAVSYELTYRHTWTVNDLVIWDNRCAMHLAVQDYDQSEMRRMIRCSLVGPKNGELFTEAMDKEAPARETAAV